MSTILTCGICTDPMDKADPGTPPHTGATHDPLHQRCMDAWIASRVAADRNRTHVPCPLCRKLVPVPLSPERRGQQVLFETRRCNLGNVIALLKSGPISGRLRTLAVLAATENERLDLLIAL